MLQISKEAIERDENKRNQYIYKCGLYYTPEQLVFIDESAFDRRTAVRQNAWAVKGQRVSRKVFFLRGRRSVFLNISCA
jgi:hypothetical protein